MPITTHVAKLPWRGIVSGVVCAVAAWLLAQTSVARGLEDWMLDGCFIRRGDRPTASKIVLIGLDEGSLDEFHKPLPFLSPELAAVVNYVDEQNAAAIGLDIIVPESLADLPELQADGRGDATLLGEAIARSGKVVLAQWKPDGRFLRPLPQWRLKAFRDPAETDLGYVDLTPDPDSFLRRQQLYARHHDQATMSFALALIALSADAEVEWDAGQLLIGEQPIPIDNEQMMRINFVGPPGRWKPIPFRDVLDAANSGARLNVDFHDSIVIIGATGASQQDWHVTPFANNFARRWYTPGPQLMSGAEVHANIAATVIDRAFVLPQTWVTSLPMLLLIGAALGVVLELMNRIRGAYRFLLGSLIAMAVFHFSWKYFCFEAFRMAHWRIEMIPVLLLGWMAYGSNFMVRWLRLRGILQVVTSATVAEQLETQPGWLGLRGEESFVTVLFADIRGFTTYSEGHSSRDVVALLNAYFTEIVPIIERHHGVLNQYMGDGVMVIFGARAPADDHAADAVRAAVEMVRCVNGEQEKWSRFDIPTMRIGVGIHTGAAILGTVGSPRRFVYTAIGDAVNTASRIESETKVHSTNILISGATYHSLSSDIRRNLTCSEITAPVHVKGKTEPLQLYRIDALLPMDAAENDAPLDCET